MSCLSSYLFRTVAPASFRPIRGEDHGFSHQVLDARIVRARPAREPQARYAGPRLYTNHETQPLCFSRITAFTPVRFGADAHGTHNRKPPRPQSGHSLPTNRFPSFPGKKLPSSQCSPTVSRSRSASRQAPLSRKSHKCAQNPGSPRKMLTEKTPLIRVHIVVNETVPRKRKGRVPDCVDNPAEPFDIA